MASPASKSRKGVLENDFFGRYRNQSCRIENTAGTVGKLFIRESLVNLRLQLGHLGFVSASLADQVGELIA